MITEACYVVCPAVKRAIIEYLSSPEVLPGMNSWNCVLVGCQVTLDSKSFQQEKLRFTIEAVRLWQNGERWDNFQLANNTLFFCSPCRWFDDAQRWQTLLRAGIKMFLFQERDTVTKYSEVRVPHLAHQGKSFLNFYIQAAGLRRGKLSCPQTCIIHTVRRCLRH